MVSPTVSPFSLILGCILITADLVLSFVQETPLRNNGTRLQNSFYSPNFSKHNFQNYPVKKLNRILDSVCFATPSNGNDEITLQLAKAKELLKEAKAKMNQQEETKEENLKTPLKSAESKIKFKDEETGLIMCDGDLMAALSEEEEWEQRSLLDVFESEIEDDEITKQLASRDVTASIRNMRLKMHNEDYRRIFDKRNRFIGEDN